MTSLQMHIIQILTNSDMDISGIVDKLKMMKVRTRRTDLFYLVKMHLKEFERQGYAARLDNSVYCLTK